MSKAIMILRLQVLLTLLMMSVLVRLINSCSEIDLYRKRQTRSYEHKFLISPMNGTSTLLFAEGKNFVESDPVTLEAINRHDAKADDGENKNDIEPWEEFCEQPCRKTCMEIDKNQTLCAFSGRLYGCPISDRHKDLKIKQRKCFDNLPIVYLNNRNNENSRIYMELSCHSTHFNFIHKFTQINSMVINEKNNILYALLSLPDDDKFVIGLCQYNVSDIIAALTKPELKASTNGIIYRDSTNKFWYRTEKFDRNGAIHLILLDLILRAPMVEFDSETNIDAYKSQTWTDLTNTEYTMHYLAESNGKIFKAVTGENFHFYKELYCGVKGDILQMEIVDDRLILLTTGLLYSLPLINCSRYMGCKQCVEARDPHCVWNSLNERCEVLDTTKHNKTDFKQDVRNGDSIRYCASADEIQDLLRQVYDKIQELENKLNNGEDILNSSIHRIDKKVSRQSIDLRGFIINITNELSNVDKIIETKREVYDLRKDIDTKFENINDFVLTGQTLALVIFLNVLIAFLICLCVICTIRRFAVSVDKNFRNINANISNTNRSKCFVDVCEEGSVATRFSRPNDPNEPVHQKYRYSNASANTNLSDVPHKENASLITF